MTTDLATTDQPPAAFSAQCLTPSAAAILDRSRDPLATFTAEEVALVESIARAVPASVPADEATLRRSLGSLAAALPSQDTGSEGSRLKLNVYMKLLDGCDERALAHGCRRCLEELDWMPTIHQLKERMRTWVNPDLVAIGKARAVMRARIAQSADDPTISDEAIQAMVPAMRRLGIAIGAISSDAVEIHVNEARARAA